jgi:hypothetical protein
MTLVDRLYDNDWYVTSVERAAHADLAVEVHLAAQARDTAVADVEQARLISPAAVTLALASINSAQAALNRAQARAAAAARCTHVVHGHAFMIGDGAAEGTPEVSVASCTLDRTAALWPPSDVGVWTAVLKDPAARYGGSATVHLVADEQESLDRACRWIVTGQL